MEWTEAIGTALRYIEDHITEDLSVERIAGQVYLSPFYFQKGFAMLCGITLADYVRSRRLALAGAELAAGRKRIIDIALRYGYDSPDSFTRAFTRFHGVTPAMARRDHVTLRSFAPLKIRISLEGGSSMNYRIEKKEAFYVLGNEGTFTYEEAAKDIPAFWQQHFAAGKGKVVGGMYGINIDEKMGRDTFRYLIADAAAPGTTAPEGFVTLTVPAFTWAVFSCTGPLPQALQTVNRRIFSEWLPAQKEYGFAAGYCVEMYDDPSKYKNGTSDEHYYCEIWIPVGRR